MVELNSLQSMLALKTLTDCFGEFIHEPFSEQLKTMTGEFFSNLRIEQDYLGGLDHFWIKYQKDREDEAADFNVGAHNLTESANNADKI